MAKREKEPLLSPTGIPHEEMAHHPYNPVTQLRGVPVLRIANRWYEPPVEPPNKAAAGHWPSVEPRQLELL